MLSNPPALSPELLPLIVCPDTHQPLHLATEEERGQWNYGADCEALLISADSTRAYPVIEGLPHLIPAESLRRKEN